MRGAHGERAPTRGAPTVGLLGRAHGGRAPTRGAPTVGFWRGAPMVGFEGAHTGGRAPTRGAPTVGLLGRAHGGRAPHGGRARTRGEGTHKGCPYGWRGEGAHTGGGHLQGVPLPDSGSLSGGKWSVEEALRFGLVANLRTWPRTGGGACFWRGALRGESPRTREGRRPDRPKSRGEE